MKMAFFELNDIEKECVRKNLKGHKLLFFNEVLSLENVDKVKDVEILGIFIYSEINKEILDKMDKLKLILTFSTGYDHIDLEECKRRKIGVCNVPNYGENTVAEHVFALILALARNIIPAVEKTKKGNFEIDGLLGFDLKGKTLGVVGTGRIGKNVIRIAKGFGMNVLAYSRHFDKNLEKELGFKYVEYKELLKKSDIVTFHVPLNEESYHMLNKENLELLKRGAVIINTARGGVIETGALLDGIKNGKIKYAGLDVLEEECEVKEERQLLSDLFKKECDLKTLLEEHMLMHIENVIITPHIAWYTEEALRRIAEIGVNNIKAFMNGERKNRLI